MHGYTTTASQLARGGGNAGAPDDEREFARLAASALSRLDRLVVDDEAGTAFVTRAKELQLRLETTPV